MREGFGRAAGFVSGWATFTLGFAAPTAVIALLAVKYLLAPYSDAVKESLPTWAARHVLPIAASALIIALGFIHGRGHRHSSWLQISATSVTAGVTLDRRWRSGVWNGRLEPLFGWLPGRRTPQWQTLGVGLVFIGYAYAGWNGAAYLAGEIRDPCGICRDVSLVAATVMVLYLLVNIAYADALDPVALKGRSDDEVDQIAGVGEGPFGEVAGVWPSRRLWDCAWLLP